MIWTVEPKQVSFDNKVDASNDDIKQQGKSNIEHLDNSKYKIYIYIEYFLWKIIVLTALKTYKNFAKKCRLCEFPESFEEFVCKEIQCMTPEQLDKNPIIKQVKCKLNFFNLKTKLWKLFYCLHIICGEFSFQLWNRVLFIPSLKITAPLALVILLDNF